MSNLPIIETVQIEYRGRTITLQRVEHPFHGSFWGWRVGDKQQDAYRHACVAFDVARAYVDRPGKRIRIYPTRVKAFGAVHDCIRVKEEIPAQVEEPMLDDAEDVTDMVENPSEG